MHTAANDRTQDNGQDQMHDEGSAKPQDHSKLIHFQQEGRHRQEWLTQDLDEKDGSNDALLNRIHPQRRDSRHDRTKEYAHERSDQVMGDNAGWDAACHVHTQQ